VSEEPGSASKRSFLQKVAVLSGATALGQLLSFAASPVTTRLFTPTDFGVSGTFAVIVGLFQVAASGRYENAIPLPRVSRDGLQLVKLCLVILFCWVILAFVVVLLWGHSMWLPRRLEALRSELIFLPLGFLGLGLFTIAEFWAIRQSYFGELSKTKLWQGAASVSVQLLTGIRHWGGRGLIVAFVVGQSAGGLRLWRLLWRDLHNSSQEDSSSIPEMARRYRNFPLVTIWAAAAKILGQYFPILFFSIHFGQEATGWLTLAQRILALPLILVGESVSRAYLSAAARLRSTARTREHQQLFFRVVRAQIGLALFILAPGLLLAPWGFEFFFGPAWKQAGVFALCSGPGLAAQLIVTPVHCQLDVAERQKLNLLGEMARWLCLGGAAGWTLRADLDAAHCAFAFGLANGLALSVIFALCCWSLKSDGARTAKADEPQTARRLDA
jgi:O-antigen/teichoic acid export membrane protein